jgi:hypothetical protein
MADAVVVPAASLDERRQTVDRLFQGAIAVTGAVTVYWGFLLVTGRPSAFFSEYRIDPKILFGVLIGFLFFNVLWGLVWFGLKTLLLAKWVGFTKEERKRAFSNRLDGGFDVADLTSRYSERRIRITDMIGRRGRFMTIGFTGFFFLYSQMAANPTPGFASAFLRDNLLEAVIGGWLFLGMYYLNGVIGAAVYGPQSRVMDGVLARANCLLINTLWVAFKFALVPIGAQLAATYPRHEFAPVFALFWGSYMVGDTASEVVGSLFGKQTIRVWGVGDVNRKSIAGTVGGFVSVLLFGAWIVSSNNLPPVWFVLVGAIAVSNTALELYSPRGTDDFTMGIGNALVAWAFGAWLY